MTAQNLIQVIVRRKDMSPEAWALCHKDRAGNQQDRPGKATRKQGEWFINLVADDLYAIDNRFGLFLQGTTGKLAQDVIAWQDGPGTLEAYDVVWGAGDPRIAKVVWNRIPNEHLAGGRWVNPSLNDEVLPTGTAPAPVSSTLTDELVAWARDLGFKG